MSKMIRNANQLDLYYYKNDQTQAILEFMPEEQKQYIKEIFSVELFDKNKLTHIASMTASYEMHELYYDVLLEDNTPEEIADEIRESIEETECTVDYTNQYSIDSIFANEPKRFVRFTGVLDSDDTHAEQIADAIEQTFAGSPVF